MSHRMPCRPNLLIHSNTRRTLTTGQLLRELIRRERFTQRDIADAIGMSLSTLNRKLSGHGPIRLSEFSQIARVLGVSPGTLLDQLEEAQR